MEKLLVKMRIKWQQNPLRMKHLKQRLFYCKAQLDLAKQNMTLCDQREKKQQQLVTSMIEILRRMEAELETLKNRWRQLKVEQRMKEVRWGLAWRSRLLEGAPHSRQMLERGHWMGNLEVLDGIEEGELIHKLACKKKYLKKWKRTTLMEPLKSSRMTSYTTSSTCSCQRSGTGRWPDCRTWSKRMRRGARPPIPANNLKQLCLNPKNKQGRQMAVYVLINQHAQQAAA